jgi:hypothetical protein
MSLSRRVSNWIPRALLIALVATLSTAASASIQPVTLSFFRITNNAPSSSNVAGQLFVDVWSAADANSSAFTAFYGAPSVSPVNVSDADANEEVLFVVRNTALIASSITRVYFDDGTILGLDRVYDKDNMPNLRGDVDFTKGALGPGSDDLPGGNAVSFHTTAGFLAKSDPAPPKNGINASNDLLGLSFSLINGKKYADTIASLTDGSLRVGVHVQALPGGYSDSFVNIPHNPPPPPPPPPPSPVVPEPVSLVVWSLLLVSVGLVTSRRFRWDVA